MNLLMFAASLRKDSCNKKLIKQAAIVAKELGAKTDLADFSEFNMPVYDADMNTEIGLPEGALKFMDRMKRADAVIISSPEYNFSTPGPLKNLIDWISRANPVPWKGVLMLLMSASPSLVGGNRGLWATRVPLECCGTIVHPDMFSLASAYDAFDEQGKLKDPNLFKRLKENIQAFIQFVENKS